MGEPCEKHDISTVPCSTCGAPIVWLVTEKGAKMPCDPAVRMVITSEGKCIRGRESHYATCRDGDLHRRGGRHG